MKTGIMNNVTRSLHRVGFKLQKHSPEILVVAGVAGVVTSTVLACKATTKLSTILEEGKANIEQINNYVEEKGYSDEYNEADHKKDLTIVKTQTGIKVAKAYAPAVALGVLSLTAILSSHHIIRKRNIALAAAYTTIDKSFKEYRERVVDRFGKDLDRELKYGIRREEIEETIVDEKGKEKKVKKSVDVVDASATSEYARFFDDGCIGWEKDAEYNLTYLNHQQNWANERLKARGHLFLNEVYDMFGIPRTKAGNVVGWIYDEKNPVGDNYVDFGIYDMHDARKRDFVNGYERVILLDFNVDGNILDLIP